VDLLTEKTIWEKNYEDGCDRMAISPDGKIIYLPSLEGDDWKVVDALSGDILYRVVTRSGSHNTIYGPDGRRVYMEGLKSDYLSVVKTVDHTVMEKVGPFANHIRPFTIDGKQTRCFVNVDGLLGFETGDLKTGRKINHIVVQGYVTGPVKRHGCPSHGIALTPDEKEIWLADAFNESIHIFDIHHDSVKQKESIKLSDQPGWITFSLDGKYAFPSTGDVIDARVKKIVARLQDEFGIYVQSEKMVEVEFRGNQPVKSGDQFGIGRMK
jgi:DNA-binding beta-propeller fold protein YncE